jgi:hypothetical protein
MIFSSRRAWRLLAAAGALASGCALEIPTSPDTFSVEPERLAHLRQPQPVEIVNGYSGPSTIEIRQSPHTLIIDRAQLTGTAIAMLRRAMEKHGISAAPGAAKKITLRIVQAAVVSAPSAPAQAVLEAQFGDGTSTTVAASNRGFSAPRALDGAVLFALNQLLVDQRFVDYLNR